jgi:putative proteasome-type protease
MTYCVGMLLEDGIIFASDSRTHAGVDNFMKFCKMTVLERAGERVLVLLSSGDLAGTQAVISILKQRGEQQGEASEPTIWTARTMFDVAGIVADAMRELSRRESDEVSFNASFLLGGQIKGEPMRLFRVYADFNFIEAGSDTQFLQTGETKYGKPIIDRVIGPKTSLSDAAKCALVSFDSTMRSNLSVGMPIDLLCYERDSLQAKLRQRFADGDPYFTKLSKDWSDGVRKVFAQLPGLAWAETPPADE